MRPSLFVPVVTKEGVASSSLLLDTVTGAFAAYSVRKIRNAQVNCLRIRRDSDDTEQDIGFSGSDLDTAAIATFCGAGSGYVSKWYDQSGNSRDLIQATTTLQPIIFESGVQTATNSKPALKIVAATAQRMSNGSAGSWNFMHNGLVVWFSSMVSTAATATGNRVAFATNNGGSSAAGYWLRRTATTNTWTMNIGTGAASCVSTITTGSASTSQTLLSQKIDPSNGTAASRSSAWQNTSSVSGSNAQTTSPSTNDSSAFTLANNTAGDTPWDGTLQELLFWNSDQSASRSTIETDINTYYTVF